VFCEKFGDGLSPICAKPPAFVCRLIVLCATADTCGNWLERSDASVAPAATHCWRAISTF